MTNSESAAAYRYTQVASAAKGSGLTITADFTSFRVHGTPRDNVTFTTLKSLEDFIWGYALGRQEVN